jgi:hypothetical protein
VNTRASGSTNASLDRSQHRGQADREADHRDRGNGPAIVVILRRRRESVMWKKTIEQITEAFLQV